MNARATDAQVEVIPIDLPTLDLVGRPRAMRRLAALLAMLLVLVPVLLTFVPWQQNVPGQGRVTAIDPLNRIRTIRAPVTGRLVRLAVQEGSRVSAGDVLAELEDQDPGYALRLEQQYQFATDKVDASRDTLEFYERQLVQLRDSREHALSSSRFELGIAIEKVRAEEQELEAREAELEQKRADRERKWNLFERGVVSELDYQKAQADYLAAQAKLEGAKAKVEQARNEERSKMASVDKVGAEQQAKIESTRSAREEARGKLALAEKERTEARTALARQATQVVLAPRDGIVLRVHGATNSELIGRGDPLIDFVPDTGDLGVEIWVRGIDAPLVSPGRKARLQFEGWPAVQFAGWPSVAVGTFGGVVSLVDAQADADGRTRILVAPDPDEEPWPSAPYLRQGVRASGWIQLEQVSTGYEIWRQLNSFPPSMKAAPPGAAPASPKAKDLGDDGKDGGKGK